MASAEPSSVTKGSRARVSSPAPRTTAAAKAAAAKAAAASKPSESKSVTEPAVAKNGQDSVPTAATSQELPGPKWQMAFLGPFTIVAIVFCYNWWAKKTGEQKTATVDALVASWNVFSDPIEKVLAGNIDLFVVLAALIPLAPLVILGVVQAFRAYRDLRNFPLWQQALLVLLVGTALVLHFLEGPARQTSLYMIDQIVGAWNQVSDPVERFLVGSADYIVASAAALCLLPVVAWTGLQVLAVLGFRWKSFETHELETAPLVSGSK